MSIDAVAAIIFIILLGIFLWTKRKQIELQRMLFPILYVVMYRSSFGLISMDKLAKKFPRTLHVMGFASIVIGFIGMILICLQLIHNTFDVFMNKAVPGIQPVLPVEAKGVFFVPFLYWILSVFLLALVHEFSHGVLARVHKIPVKSSGFAFLCLILPIIPAAFVEPDEKVIQKRPYRQQLSVFAAGPVSNMVFALLMLGLFFALSPVLSAAFEAKGVEIAKISSDSPAFAGGLRENDIITSINDIKVNSTENISAILNTTSPGEQIIVQTKNNLLYVTLGSNPDNSSKPFLGIQARPYVEAKQTFVSKYGAWLPPTLKWIAGLVFWLFMLNVGIGFFNLLPIGPLDGGRMFQLACFKFFKNKQTALRVWSWTSIFFVAVIIANLLAGFVH